MGVRGLTSFVDNNPDLLQDHKLKDTKLVIDGSSLYFYIYLNMNLRHKFGGDYDLFALRCRQVLQVLLDCHVEPYIVFDGAYSRDDRKLKTSLERKRKMIRAADSISRGCHGKMLPLLAYETFVAVLRELRIPHVTCDEEADDQLVLLANKFCCPVMSVDSDFYIFDITAGYIPTDYVDFAVYKDVHTKSKYLSCQIYHIDNLVDRFKGLTKANLPLAATVLGNDFTSEDNFVHFFAALKLPKGDTRKTDTNRGYHRLLKLFHWLASLDNPQTAGEQILRYVPPKLKEKLRAVVRVSVDGYRKLSEGFDLLEFFQSGDTAFAKTSLQGYNGSSIPNWFMAKVRKTELPVFLLNAITLHRTIHFSLVEHTPSPSAHACSSRLREILYGIILKEDLKRKLGGAKMERQTTVEEYDRHVKDCRKSYVEPCTALDKFGPLPGLSELPSLSKGSCEALLFESLTMEKVNFPNIPSSLLLYISCIIFWIRNASPKATVDDLKALILCMIFVHVKQRRVEKQARMHEDDEDTSAQELDLESASNRSSLRQLQMLDTNLSKHSRCPTLNHKNVLNMRIIHSFAQFQTCLLMAKHLNKLLGCPLEDSNPKDFLNGTFLYNISHSLEHRPRPDLFVSEMLVKRSPFESFFRGIVDVVLTNLPDEDCLLTTSPKKGSKRKKQERQTESGHANQDDFGEDNSEGGKVGKLTHVAACDLSNRFSAFSVSGDSD